MGAIAIITAVYASTLSLSCPEKISLVIAIEREELAAAPAAWSMRENINMDALDARAQRKLATMYTASPKSKGLRRPNLSEIGP
ncbi:hypothetical protein MTHERMMSTA1_19710 [Methanosarcina thermophila MST-A1]|uniref:Serine/threonine-protein kinase ppk11 n=1 Tax=Methanosarcina thermophila TaxID=2210 RepID=A0A3G9CVQ7_METTE|nr:serine/threonine-protein kinase ppk11 [Methanosarcina thermophila]GLI14845.1 hypothetical protein MTHERMMSTA1_19710 [Methanosarcina thermophila MST-A1]